MWQLLATLAVDPIWQCKGGGNFPRAGSGTGIGSAAHPSQHSPSRFGVLSRWGMGTHTQQQRERFQQFETEECLAGRLGRQEARVVAFLASPAGSWVNGAMIAVDGAQQQPAMFHKGPLWR